MSADFGSSSATGSSFGGTWERAAASTTSTRSGVGRRSREYSEWAARLGSLEDTLETLMQATKKGSKILRYDSKSGGFKAGSPPKLSARRRTASETIQTLCEKLLGLAEDSHMSHIYPDLTARVLRRVEDWAQTAKLADKDRGSVQATVQQVKKAWFDWGRPVTSLIEVERQPDDPMDFRRTLIERTLDIEVESTDRKTAPAYGFDRNNYGLAVDPARGVEELDDGKVHVRVERWDESLIEAVFGKENVYEQAGSLFPGKAAALNHDQTAVMHNEFCTILALADGCGWGEHVAELAHRVCSVGVETLAGILPKIASADRVSTKEIVQAHDQAFFTAGKVRVEDAGTTFQLSSVVEDVLTVTKLGDGKVFVVSGDLKSVFEVTEGSDRGGLDPTDCGGRLSGDDQIPHDLRNLSHSMARLKSGDIVISVSDGTHDNLDPKLLGKTPKELGLADKEWNESEEHTRARSDFANRQLLEILIKAAEGRDEPLTAELVDAALFDYVQRVTVATHVHYCMGGGKPSSDYKEMPGKVDNASSVIYIHP